MTTPNESGRVPPKNAARKTTAAKCSSNSADDQRARILEALRAGPLSTIDIRRRLDVMMPAARIHELRHTYRKNITTVRVDQPTDGGRLHRVAQYVLNPDPQTDLFGGPSDFATLHSQPRSAAKMTQPISRVN